MRAVTLLAALILSLPAIAKDGEWFEHRFGEQRAYFGDWLAVCNDSGAGQCRLVQIPPADAPDEKYYRVALVLLEDQGDYVIELSARNMPAAEVINLNFEVDGNTITAKDGSWKMGDNTTPNIADTVTLVDQETVRIVMEGMADGLSMTVQYLPTGNGLGSFTTSLKGVVAGTKAIEAIYAKR